MSKLEEIAREFPDFPLDSIPEGIPSWLEACPWHNETCPLWGDEAYVSPDAGTVGTALAVDFPDPQMREFQDAPRFSCWLADAHGNQQSDTVASDDFAVVLRQLEAWHAEDVIAAATRAVARGETG